MKEDGAEGAWEVVRKWDVRRLAGRKERRKRQ